MPSASMPRFSTKLMLRDSRGQRRTGRGVGRCSSPLGDNERDEEVGVHGVVVRERDAKEEVATFAHEVVLVEHGGLCRYWTKGVGKVLRLGLRSQLLSALLDHLGALNKMPGVQLGHALKASQRRTFSIDCPTVKRLEACMSSIS